MNQLTIRQVPDDVASKLREVAEERGLSLNKAAIAALADGLGVKRSSKRRDLTDVSGSWSEEDATEFASHTASFDEIEDELWR